MKKLLIALIAGVAAMSAAQAQNAYVGAAVTTSDTKFNIAGANDDGWKASGKIFGGWDVNEMWGVEAGYTDLRSAEGSYRVGNTPGRISTDGSRTYLAAKAQWPVNQQVSVYGKLGASYNKLDVSTSVPNVSYDDHDTEAYGAVGAQYRINQNVSLIAEYERYGKKKDFGPKADAFTIGARYNF